jgi:hypothetical protein
MKIIEKGKIRNHVFSFKHHPTNSPKQNKTKQIKSSVNPDSCLRAFVVLHLNLLVLKYLYNSMAAQTSMSGSHFMSRFSLSQ